ncbi:hypothetical protein [Cohnella sp. GCM10027633]|uniref:hypothetical protein n=1 Tax=unclassified Cohnella TaxID=2636738 RepID=UPI00362FAF5F
MAERIGETYRKLSERGIAMDACKERDGIIGFHVRSPEGLLIRITDKEAVPIEQPY